MGTEGTLFGCDCSEVAMEGAKDLLVEFVTGDDWWGLFLEVTRTMPSLPLDHYWWCLMGVLARSLLIMDAL